MRSRGLRRSQIAEKMHVSEKTVSEWLRGRGPLHPAATRETIEAVQARGVLRESAEPYQLAEVREVRTFTSLVEALRKIDRSDGRTYRAAWRVLMASAEAVRTLAGWTDADWAAAITKDHWRTLTKEPEERAIGRALDTEGGVR